MTDISNSLQLLCAYYNHNTQADTSRVCSISESFSRISFRGTHGEKHTLISNSAIVEVLLTLTDNSNYFSECAFWSLPNVSWQIIKKTSGLFDTETKYKGVFLATIKGCQLCSGEISAQKIIHIHVPLVERKSQIKMR